MRKQKTRFSARTWIALVTGLVVVAVVAVAQSRVQTPGS
jgi:hypothetical protein